MTPIFRIFDLNLTRIAIAMCALLCAGCSGGRTITLDEDIARQSLTKALDAWKSGGKAEDLQHQAPAIAVNDVDWSHGRKLVGFQVNGNGTSDGRSLHVPVTLTMQPSQRGAAAIIKATYAVGVDPAIVVVRETEGD